MHQLIYQGKGRELDMKQRSPQKNQIPKRRSRMGSPLNSNASLPWVKKKKKITKKLNADKEFEKCYANIVQGVANSIDDPQKFKEEFTLSTYARKMEKMFKGQIKEKREFILKFDKNQDIYRQNDFKYNSVKFGKEMWNMKLDDSLRFVQKELKLTGYDLK